MHLAIICFLYLDQLQFSLTVLCIAQKSLFDVEGVRTTTLSSEYKKIFGMQSVIILV